MDQPLVFFNLSIKSTAQKREIIHWADEKVVLAPTCAKTSELQASKEELQTAGVQLLTTQWQPTYQKRDVSGAQQLSCCAMLDYAAEAPEAECMPEVVQVNWVRIEEPGPGSEILDKSGSRIWFLSRMSDATGCTQVGIPQTTALALGGCQTKEEFEQAHSNGSLQFPLFHNVRMTRTTTPATTAAERGNDSSQTQAPGFVSHVLEEAIVVSYEGHDAPNNSFQDIMKILSQCPRHDHPLLFASLAELHTCPHYGFEVKFHTTKSCGEEVTPFRGSAIVAVVGSTEKSKVEACGTGWKVTTKNLSDLLAEKTGTQTDVVWDAVAYCTTEQLLEFKLDPPRGSKMRFAVVVISAVEDRGESSARAVLEKVQMCEATELDGILASFRKLRRVCRSLTGSQEPIEKERRRAMPAVLGPLPKQIKLCRSISRAPTDATMPSPTEA